MEVALLSDYITYHRGKRIGGTSRAVVVANHFGMIGVGAVFERPWHDGDVALCRRKMITAASGPSGEGTRWAALVALGVAAMT